jgi:hypothetical protein
MSKETTQVEKQVVIYLYQTEPHIAIEMPQPIQYQPVQTKSKWFGFISSFSVSNIKTNNDNV